MHLKRYRQQFEEELPLAIATFGEKSNLRDACEYSLLSGGKRLRPLIVMMTAEALSFGLNVLPVALSVEFFHTASLIADDLPCMDNDEMRRDRLSLHKAFDEATAILASYTLIAEGYRGIHLNQQLMRQNSRLSVRADEAASLCLAAASHAAGIQGATGGQYLDLFPPNENWETVEKIFMKKTVTLFEISFLFGWLFGGGSSGAIDELKRIARHLGMAFQIADDLQDKGDTVNISALFGKERAISLFEKEIALFQDSLKKLDLWTEPFQELHHSLLHNFFSSCR